MNAYYSKQPIASMFWTHILKLYLINITNMLKDLILSGGTRTKSRWSRRKSGNCLSWIETAKVWLVEFKSVLTKAIPALTSYPTLALIDFSWFWPNCARYMATLHFICSSSTLEVVTGTRNSRTFKNLTRKIKIYWLTLTKHFWLTIQRSWSIYF